MKNEKKQQTSIEVNQITEGVIWKQLLIFFFPILFGTFFQQLYNTVDAMIVGRFVGKEALAAVGGSTGTLINLLVGFFVGLSSGATVIISQYYGAKNSEKVSQAIHTAVAFSIVGGIVLTIIGILISPYALRWMDTPEDIFDYALTYIRIYFIGIIGNIIYNMGSGILRAIGDSKRPLYFLIVSCIVNIILDILFVVVLKMNVAGAALATILSQLVSALLVFYVLTKSRDVYQLEISKIKLHISMVKKIIQIGFPAGIQSALYSISNIIIQSSVNSLKTDTIAAWTAYSKIDAIFWMIVGAFGISITTFVGQNYGAGKTKRVHEGIAVCMKMTILTTIFVSILLYLFGGRIYYLFTSDPIVIEKGIEILQFIVPFFITYICIEILSGALRGAADCWIPTIITCLGVCVLRVLWILYAVPLYRTVQMILFSYPLTWIITSLAFIIYYRYFSKLKQGFNLLK